MKIKSTLEKLLGLIEFLVSVLVYHSLSLIFHSILRLLHNWEHWRVLVTSLEQFYLLKKHFTLEVTSVARSRSLNVFPVNTMYFFWSTVEVCGDLVQSLSWMCDFRPTITFLGFHSVIWVVRHGRILQTDWLLFTVRITHIELSTFYIIFVISLLHSYLEPLRWSLSSPFYRWGHCASVIVHFSSVFLLVNSRAWIQSQCSPQ